MKIAFCEDNQIHRSELISMLLDCSLISKADEYYEFSSAEDLLSFLSNGDTLDLIFLDIELEKINGIKAGEIVRKYNKNTIIIFVTAYPNYAIQAYECEPLYYLLKPTTEKMLKKVWEKVINKYKAMHQFFIIKNKDHIIQVPINEIVYVEIYNRHLIIHTNQTTYKAPGKLNDAFIKLQPFGFCQNYHGCIVNINYIREISQNTIYLSTKEKLPLSVRKKHDVLKNYVEYMEGEI